jgi:hypothetical protein
MTGPPMRSTQVEDRGESEKTRYLHALHEIKETSIKAGEGISILESVRSQPLRYFSNVATNYL